MLFGLLSASLSPISSVSPSSPTNLHLPRLLSIVTALTRTQFAHHIARSWHRSLLGLALPLAIVGHAPANAQLMPPWINRGVSLPIETGGRSRTIVPFGSGRELSLPVLSLAIEAVSQNCDQPTPPGVVRFEPPTDDEIGETGSGATRSACVGVFSRLPVRETDLTHALCLDDRITYQP